MWHTVLLDFARRVPVEPFGLRQTLLNGLALLLRRVVALAVAGGGGLVWAVFRVRVRGADHELDVESPPADSCCP